MSAGERITDVSYICQDELTALSEEVNKWIEDGWQPFGPVQITPRDWYLQTLVHYGHEIEE